MDGLPEVATLAAAAGGVGGFGGAFAAIKVHIHYINKSLERHEHEIDEAHRRIDQLREAGV